MTKIEIVIVALIILLMILTPIVPILTISNFGATSGNHTGIITAVESNRLIYSTQRAFVKTSQETTQEDTYCVQDQEVYDKLSEFSETGETVILTFSHPLIEWRWNCSGDEAIITDVKLK